MRPVSEQSGFTLLEMLGATALLAVALGILLTSMSQSMQMLVKDDVKTRIGLVARSLIAEVDNTPLPLGLTEGEQDNFAWRLDCTEIYVNNEAGIRLLQLRLTLRQGSYQEAFSTLRAQSITPGRL
ncbi:proteinral secretion pathway protein GspI [Pseudomonas syringae pv. philadelphi]|uniref:Proteinral secretion pathway protein GspI n=1 Tax=Pseudomonas syringae pv. philadelphi TaxID=251706 RepID=A0A3M3ZU27_9PSED|nr:type II secretion system protein [Pseudomonas syringae group genomosp. 3]RMO98128.1 proteinral secretion pathway protein GspI [Pseudomonas syringae pv. philadelphi]